MKKHQQQKNQDKSLYWKGIFGGVLASVITFTLILNLGLNLNSFSRAGAQQNLTDFESVIVDTAAKASEAVVSVENYQANSQNQVDGGFFNRNDGIDLEQFDQEPILVGSGSGVVYKIDGDKAFIVTNNHVVEGSDKLEVQMKDGRKTEATLLGSDVYSDLAVLSIPSEFASTTLKFANSDQIQVGNLAIAIGSPVGSDFATSVTQGIISGLNREVDVDTNGDQVEDWKMTLLQTDAAINPGNSGGALVNSKGELMGINSIKYASTDIEGMGFAIPSNDVKTITEQLEKDGKVTRPLLGVSTVELGMISAESRQSVLKLDPSITDGVIVMDVSAGSAAESAGFAKYDVITKVDDTDIVTGQDLRQVIFSHQIGDKIKITYLREGKENTVEVTLSQAMPNNN